LVMCSVWKMSDALGKHYTGCQLKRGVRGRPRKDYMERHDNEGHQSDECDVGWNLPNSNGQTGVESMDRPLC